MDNKDQPINAQTVPNEYGCDVYTGLTKREYFAGLAMQGLIEVADKRGWHYQSGSKEGATETVGKTAVHLADSLLKALENRE